MSPARHAIEERRRPGVWTLAAAVAVVVVVVGAVAAVITLRTPGDPDVATEANRFRPLAGWWQVEIEDRSGAGCLEAGCPSSYRRWQVDNAPTPDDLRKSFEAAGWPAPAVEGTCQAVDGRTGSFPLCTASATGDDMRFTVTVTEDDAYQVALTVESV
ncbi:hypothetical protein [Cryptosporangium phraense]|uniref:Uncharacterized protein n=1 Tax=Cryptosporangium phraense TaxID=2593070 RepID=A0A545AHI8_9ACTN|nr:hypothetical protein [Cryptosporangium phraense]TQS40155.1 hypothetical protein FL583_36115 [Cryptosporangium phraense]